MSEALTMQETESTKKYVMDGGKLYQGGTECLYWQLTPDQKEEYFPERYLLELEAEAREKGRR